VSSPGLPKQGQSPLAGYALRASSNKARTRTEPAPITGLVEANLTWSNLPCSGLDRLRAVAERDDAPMPSAQQRVALVTGSTRGLGRAIAERLARDGLAVAVNGLHGDGQSLEVVNSIRNGARGVADAFAADITDERQVADLVAAITDRLGTIDVLVLNATGPQPEAPLAEVAWEDHLAQLAFFVKSPVLLVRALLPAMRARGFGRIIQVDSEVVNRPPTGRSAYVTAKSAQIGLTRAWARELAHLGITVNTVAPGFIPVERHADVPNETKAAYLATVPTGRMGTPEDVAHAVSFFASEAAGFITGQRLLVDGGRNTSD
jgi:3-oxoacyl-[acyl-carrier protein] reductase